MLVQLNNGNLMGGYWGAKSYAGSYPNDGDIYFGAVYRLDASHRFGEPIPNTSGVLLRKDQYIYIELFSVPHLPGKRDDEDKRGESRQSEKEGYCPLNVGYAAYVPTGHDGDLPPAPLGAEQRHQNSDSPALN